MYYEYFDFRITNFTSFIRYNGCSNNGTFAVSSGLEQASCFTYPIEHKVKLTNMNKNANCVLNRRTFKNIETASNRLVSERTLVTVRCKKILKEE
jgi:hypothetical protein